MLLETCIGNFDREKRGININLKKYLNPRVIETMSCRIAHK